jgi:hypothetical protein
MGLRGFSASVEGGEQIVKGFVVSGLWLAVCGLWLVVGGWWFLVYRFLSLQLKDVRHK